MENRPDGGTDCWVTTGSLILQGGGAVVVDLGSSGCKLGSSLPSDARADELLSLARFDHRLFSGTAGGGIAVAAEP